MAEEEETREVLFPDWEGPDKTGLTIDQTTEGEIFVKEVKGESPAARSGRVYEGDQIVGATIYFDNMSSEETADLLKTLNRHKVGLKLQNKGDKSPCYSPLSTPCRSPIGTLTWEGKSRFGGSSPDIILGGDDEDYKRIYTKKIKPRLKSEDLAEGVDVRTERHSSTSSDGSTITTITRRITTYTVDMPGGVSEQLEFSSPQFKGQIHESGDGSPRTRISHGSPAGKVGPEEGGFDLGNVSYTGPQLSSTETHLGSGGVKTTTITTESERLVGSRYKGPNFGVTGITGQEGFEISSGRGEQGDRSMYVSGTSMTIRGSTDTGSEHMITGGLGCVAIPLSDESVDARFEERSNASGGDTDIELQKGRIRGSSQTLGNITSRVSSKTENKEDIDVSVPGLKGVIKSPEITGPGKISVADVDVDIQGPKRQIQSQNLVGGVDMSRAVIQGVVAKHELNIKGTGIQSKGANVAVEVPVVGVRLPSGDRVIRAPSIDVKSPKIDSSYTMEVSKTKISSLSGPDMHIGLKGSSIKGTDDESVQKTELKITASKLKTKDTVTTEGPGGGFKMPQMKVPSLGVTGTTVEGPDPDNSLSKAGIQITLPKKESTGAKYVDRTDVNIKSTSISGAKMSGVEGNLRGRPFKTDAGISLPNSEASKFNIKGPIPKMEGSDVDVNLPKSDIDVKASKVDIKVPEVGFKGPDVKIKSSTVKMSSIPGPNTPEFDLNLKDPRVQGNVEVSTPELEIKGPYVGIEGSRSNIKGPKIQMPSISGQTISVPAVDFKLTGPKLKGDVDVSVPKIEGDFKTPELNIKAPQISIDESKGGINLPKIKIPSSVTKEQKLKSPDVDLDLPKADIDMKAPKIDVKVAKLGVDSPGVSVEGTKITMPSVSAPKGPGFDLENKGPTFGGVGDVSLPKFEGDIKAPKVGFEGPDVDIGSASGKMTGPQIEMPSFTGPVVSMSDVDLKMKSPTLKGDVDVSVPNIEGDFKTPELNIKAPKLSIDEPKSGINLPKITFPSFGRKGPEIEGPDVDLDLPKADIDFKAPKIDVKVAKPDFDSPDVSVEGPKITMPSVSAPKGPGFDLKIKGPKFGGVGDVSLPKMEGDIKAPKVGFEGPDVDIGSASGKMTGPKIEMPSFTGPVVSMSDVDLKMKSPKLKGDVDVSVPNIEGDFKTPELNIKAPKLSIDEPKSGINLPKITFPSFGRKGPKIEGPDVDLDLPKADIDFKAPKIDVKVAKPDFDSPDVSVEGPKITMPSVSAPKGPGFDLKFKGPTFGGVGDVSLPKMEGDIEAPKVGFEGPDVAIGSASGKMTGPKIEMPSFTGPVVSMSDVDLKMKSPKLKGDVDVSVPNIEGDFKTPELNIKAPKLSIDEPKSGINLPKITFPSFGGKGPKFEGPDVDLDLPKADIDFKAPKIDVKVAKPEFDSPDVSVDGPKITMPSVSAPKGPGFDLEIKGPKFGGVGDVSLPKMEGDIKAPKVGFEGPDVDIGSASGKMTGPKIEMPSFTGPVVSMSDVDLKMKSPKLKGDVDVSVPNIEGDFKTPELNIKAPKLSIDEPKSGINLPKMKFPSFGRKGPKIEGPDVDLDLPKADIDFKAPKIDVKVAKPDFDSPDVSVEGPKITMPSVSAPKGPGFDLKIKGPKFGGVGDVSLPTFKGDIKAPKVGFEGPDVDIGSASGKMTGPKIEMPSFTGPVVSMSDVDLKMKSPKLKGDVDVSVPNIEGDFKTPELNIKAPKISIDEPKSGINLPKMKFPSFGRKGPKIEGPDVDLDLPKADIDFKAPKIDVKVAKPDFDSPDVSVEGPKITMPSVSAPKGPGFDLKIKGPTFGGVGEVSLPKMEGDIKAPKVGFEGPDVDIGSASGKMTGPKIEMPSFTGPVVSMSDVDLKMKSPKLTGDVDVSVPNIEGDFKTPELNIKAPKLSIDEPKSGINLPKMKFPSFGRKGPKIEGPDVDLDLPKADIDFKAPKIDVKVAKPDFDSPDVSVEGPKITMPSVSAPKGPGFDLKIKGPKFGGVGDVSLPTFKGDIKAPKVGFEGPDVDIGSASGKMTGPKIEMPSFTGPVVSMSDVDLKMKSPKLKGDLDVSVPNIEGDFKTPELNIKAPKISIDEPKSGINLPKIKFPSFGRKGPKIEGPDVDLDLPKADIDFKAPKIDVKVAKPDFDSPDVSVEGPKITMPSVSAPKGPGFDLKIKGPTFGGVGEVSLPKMEGDIKAPKVGFEGPDVDIGSASGKMTGPKIEMPSFTGPVVSMSDVDLKMKSPKLKGDVDVSVPNIEGDFKTPELNIKAPKISIDEPKSGINLPKMKFPSFGRKGPKIEGPDVDLDLPKADIDFKAPKIDVKVAKPDFDSPDVSVEGPRITMPSVSAPKGPGFDLKIKGPTFGGVGEVSLPKMEGDIKAPKVGFEGPDVDIGSASGKMTGPQIEMPSFTGPVVSMSDVDLKMKSPKLKGDLDVSVPNIEGDFKTPELNIKAPKISIDEPKSGINLPKMKFPSFGRKGPKIEGPDVDLDLPKADIDFKAPKIDVKVAKPDFDSPDVSVEGPKITMPSVSAPKGPGFDLKIKGPKFGGVGDVSLPTFKGDIKAPKVGFEGPDVDIGSASGKMTGPKIEMPSFTGPVVSMSDVDLKMKSPKLKGDVDVSVPNIEGDFKTPELNIKAPKLSIDEPKSGINLPKIKFPSFGRKGPQIEGPDVDLDLPKADIDFKAPKIDVKLAKPDFDSPDVSVGGPKITMPSVSAPKGPGFDLKFKGPTFEGVGDVSLPKMEGDIKAPKVGFEGPDVDIGSASGKMTGPKIEMPSFTGPVVSMSDVEFKMKSPKLKGDVNVSVPNIEGDFKTPELNIKAPKISIDEPKSGISLPKIKFPSFGRKGPKMEGPDVDLDLPKADIDFKAPKIDVKVAKPDFDSPDVSVEGPKITMPSVSEPKGPGFDLKIKGPTFGGIGDVSLPKFEGDIKAPKVGFEGPDVDIGSASGKMTGPKIEMPSFTGPVVSMSDVDLKMKSPKLKGDVDVSVPEIEGDFKTPELNIKAPKLSIDEPKSGINLPKIKFPSFGRKGPKMEGPDVDLDLPKADIDFKAPKIDVKVAKPDFDGPDVSVEGPKITMPSVSAPKGPGFDLKIKGPTFGGVGEVSLPKFKGDIKAPKVGFEGPDVDIASASGKMTGPKIEMPSFTGPVVSMSDVDLKMKSPTLKGDVDVSVPNIEGDFKTPELNIKAPKISIDEPKSGINLPKITFPSFGRKGPKIEGPDVDLDLPKADIDVKVPKIDVKVPKPDFDSPDVSMGGPKITMPSVSKPKLPGFDLNFKGPKFGGDGDIKAPRVDVEGLDVDIDSPRGKVKGTKFKMPTFSGPKGSKADVDFKLKGPALKGDVDVSIPRIKGDIKTTDLDIDAPKIGIEGPKTGFGFPKIKFPSFGMKGRKHEGPEIDINLPKPDIDVKVPKVDIKMPVVDVEGPDVKVQGYKFQMPSVSVPQVPEYDLKVKGPKLGGDVDVSLPKIKGDIKAPKVDFEGPNVDIDSASGKMKLPKFNLPSLTGPKVSMPDVDFRLKGPEIKGDVDVSGPKIKGGIETPDLDINVPTTDFKGPKGGIGFPKVNMPSFGVKIPKLEGPDVDLSLPKADIDVKAPKVDINLPPVDFEGPDVNVEGPKFKLPSMSLPKVPDFDFKFKGPKLGGDVDVSLPKVEGDIKTPKVDFEGPNVDIDSAGGKMKLPKFNLPSFTGPKVSMPDLDFSLKGPEIKGDVDVSVPEIKGGIKTPQLDINVPTTDFEGPKGGFGLPKFSMPSFGLKSPKLEGPDVDLNLPKADIDVNAPKVDINLPHVDFEGPDVNVQGPKFKLPTMKVPKVPDIDFKFKGPKFGGGLDASLPKIEGDIKTPKVDFEGPDFDNDGESGKMRGPKIKMPTIMGPKVSMPDLDFSLKGPEIKGDVDVSVPEIKGGIKTPQLDIKVPTTDFEGPKGGFGLPKFNMPSIGFRSPKLEGPNVDLDLPKADIDVNAPKVDINLPQVDFEGPDVNVQGPKFKLPTMKVPKVPDIDFKFKGPKFGGGVDASLPKFDGDIKTPKMDFEGPDVDIDGASGKIKVPKLKMPSFTGPYLTMPNVDFHMKSPELKGDVDVSGPKVKGGIKTPKLDIDVPKTDLEGPKGGFGLPKFNLPSFGLKSPKLEGPDVDLDLPKADIDVNAPKVDINLPQVDFEGPDMNVQGPKIKLPTMSLPKVPDFDFKFKGPKLGGDVDVSLPKIEGDIEAPKMDFEGPDVDIDGASGKIKVPKLKMPTFSGPNLTMPNVDFHMKSPELKGDVDVSGPKIKGEIKTPKLDINVPKTDLEGPKGGFGLPKFRMPSFGIRSPKPEGPDVDLNLPKADIDVKAPKIDMKGPKLDVDCPDVNLRGSKFKLPSMSVPKVPDIDFKFKGPKFGGDVDMSLPKVEGDIETPKVNFEGPNVDIDSESGKMKLPKFNLPSLKGPKVSMPDVDFRLKGPEMKGDVDVSVPEIKGGIKTPDLDINVPTTDFKGPKGGIGFPKLSMPSFGVKSPKLEGPDVDLSLPKADIDVKAPKVDINLPQVDFDGPDVNVEGPKFKLPSMSFPKVPDFDFKFKGPKLGGDVDVSLPKIEGDIKAPKVDFEGPDVDIDGASGKIKVPKLKMPSFTGPNLTMPNVDFHMKSPELKGDVDVSGPKVKGGIKTPKLDIDVPKTDLEGPKGGFGLPKFSMPSFGFRSPKLEGPDVDLDLPKADIDVNAPKADINLPQVDFEDPDVNVHGPKFKLPTMKVPKVPDIDLKFKGPKFGGGVDASLPKIEGDIKAPKMDFDGPDVDIDGASGKIKVPKLKMPSFTGPSLTMPNVDFHMKSPELKGDVDVSGPKVKGGIKTPKLDIDVPKTDLEGPKGGFGLPKFNLPSFGLKSPKLEGPDVDLDLPKADIDVNAPKVDINLPQVDFEGPDVNVHGPKFKLPTMKVPKVPDIDLKFKGPKFGGGVDASLPKIEADIKAPKMDFEGPDVDIDGASGKIKVPKLKMPSFTGPNLTMPNVDFHMKSPELKGDVDVSGPKIKGGIKPPKLDIDVPKTDLEGPKGGFGLPKFNLPSFGFKSPKLEGPDVDLDLPKADIDVSAPKVDINLPQVDFEGPDVNVQGPKFKMPTMKVPKVPDIDLKFKGPKFGGGVDASLPKIEADIKAPKMDFEGPDVDIDGASGKIKVPKLKMPSFTGPNLTMPNVDFHMKSPELKGDVDVSGPKIKGGIKPPKLDIDVPKTDLEGPKGGFGLPKFNLPSFGFKSPKLEGPDVDLDLPKADIDVSAPKVDINLPQVDFEGPDVNVQGPKFKMPTMKVPKVPDIDLKFKGPKFGGGVDASLPKIEADIKAPKMDFEGPDVDIDGASGKIKVPKLKMPAFSGPNLTMPNVDFHMKSPELKGDVDVSGPKIKGGIKTPKLDINVPKTDLEGPKGGFGLPKFNIPSFGFKSPKLEGPDVDLDLPKADIDVSAPKVDINLPQVDFEGPDVNVQGPKFKMPTMKVPKVPDFDLKFKGPKFGGGVDASLPKIEGDIKTPKMDFEGPDVDIDGASGKIKVPKLKMPTFSGPNLTMPDVDFHMKGPKLKGDVDVSGPKIKGGIKSPKLDIDVPKTDLGGPKGGFGLPKFRMPSFGIRSPKPEGPDVDLNLPQADIDVKAPKVDINLPQVDFEGPDVNVEGPKFKMPSMSLPKVPDFDLKFKGPKLGGGVDASLPKIEGDIKAPKMDFEGPDVDIDGASGKIKVPKLKMPTFSGPNLTMPNVDFHMKSPELKGDVDVSGPKIKGEIKTPKLDINVPKTDLEGPKGGFGLPKFRMPSFGIRSPKPEGPDVDLNLPKADIDVNAPKIDMKGPKLDVDCPDVNLRGSKFKLPSMSVPKVPDIDFKFKGPKFGGDVDMSLPKVEGDIETPKVNFEGPNVDIDSESGKMKLPKFNLPSLKGPKVSMPDVDFRLKGPEMKGDVDVSVPEIKGGIKTPDLDINVPTTDFKGPKGGIGFPKLSMPSFGVKSPKLEGPDVDLSLPKADIDVKAPKVDINLPQVDFDGPDVNVEGPKFKLPSMSFPKVPDFDFKFKGPKLGGDVDVSLPKIEGDVKTPKVDFEGPDVDIDGESGKMRGPKIKMPTISGSKVSMPDLDFSLKGPEIKGDVDLSVPKIKGGIKTPQLDINVPKTDFEGPKAGFGLPKFHMPSFGFSSPKLEGPDVDLDLPKADIDVNAPKVDINLPQVDFEGPDVIVQGPKFKLPTMKVPKVPDIDLKFKGHKFAGGVDASLPKIEGDIKTPKMDFEGPDVDIDGASGKIKVPKLKMPSFTGPNLTMPNVDFHMKSPELKGDVDVSGPKVKGGIKTPKLDIDVPKTDLEGPKGGFGLPKFNIPSFGFKSPKPEGPDVDLDLPKADIDVSAAKVDINLPQVDFEGPDVNVQGPKFKLPTMKVPNVPDIDLKFKGPKFGGGVDASLPKIEADIKAPKMDFEGPDVDIDGASGKIKVPKLKMPTFSGPNLTMPNVDFGMKSPELKGDVDVSVPKIKGEIKTPKLEIDVPKTDLEGPKGGFGLPKFRMPSFGIRSPKPEGPDVDLNLPKADIDVKAPKIDLKGPKLDVDCPDVNLRGSKFKLPSMSVPQVPDIDLRFKGPKFGGDVDMSLPKVEGDIKAPKVDFEGPNVDIDGASASGKMKLPKFNVPTLKGPKVSMPDVDFRLKGPEMKGDVDVSVPEIKGGIKTPDLDINVPATDFKGPKGGIGFPKLSMPSFGVKSPKLEGPDVDLNLPKADIDVKAPKVDINMPHVDFEGPDVNVEGPKFKLPSMSFPKVPDFDFKFKGPKLGGGDVDLSLPKIEGDIKTPKVDFEGPDVDIDGESGKMRGPKVSMPDLDFSLRGPEIKGDVDVSVPKIKGGIKTPQLDINVPTTDFEGPKAGFGLPKFHMPSFGFSSPKFEGPDVDLDLPKADIDVKAPKIDTELNLSGPDISMPHGSLSLTGPDLKGGVGVFRPQVGGDIQGPELPKGGLTVTSSGFKVSGMQGPGVDVNLPKVDIKGPALDVEGPQIKMPSVSRPNISVPDLEHVSMPKLEGDVKIPNVNIDAPTISMEGLSTDTEALGVRFPKFKGPKFGIKYPASKGSVSMTKTSMSPKADVNFPEVETSLDTPDIDFTVKGKKGKFKLPKVKGKAKKLDVDIETPGIELDVDAPNINVKAAKDKKSRFGKLHFPNVELDIKSPKAPNIDSSASLNTNIEVSSIGHSVSLEGTDVKCKSPNIKMSKVTAPGIDVNLNGQGEAEMSTVLIGQKGNVKGDVEMDKSVSTIGGLRYPEGTVTFPKIKVPTFGIILPQLEGEGGIVESEPAARVDINTPTPSVSCHVSSQSTEVPSPELRHSEGKVRVKMPKFFGKTKRKGTNAGELKGPEVELGISGKGEKTLKDLHSGSEELLSGKLEFEGVSVSPKGKSASLDLFKKSRHRSSSLSDEGGLAVSSPSTHLEAEGGDLSLDLGGAKARGKKGKLKFGTFGGFGSKSKGSYEVTLGEDSGAAMEGSTSASLPSKKSRLSSSSSSESGSKGGFRFPRLELSVSPKKL
ncbi:neuroblast differentiation-associated protein AHNAK isoform X5 [Genypterus blacodes]|uniref:neuroblast differentiation-associated protein AHNAK isoform X5 n=1 Tax=Genypterus blacodes TaxID=154954 RepID=UPI003F75E814